MVPKYEIVSFNVRSLEKMLDKKFQCPSRENKAVQVCLPYDQNSFHRSKKISQDYSDEQSLRGLPSRNQYHRTHKFRDKSHNLLQSKIKMQSTTKSAFYDSTASIERRQSSDPPSFIIRKQLSKATRYQNGFP